jgi:hypothetical protein
MNLDDIIRLANEAGLWLDSEGNIAGGQLDSAPRFAALVAAAERERLAAKFMEMHNAQQHRNNYFAFAARVIREEEQGTRYDRSDSNQV